MKVFTHSMNKFMLNIHTTYKGQVSLILIANQAYANSTLPSFFVIYHVLTTIFVNFLTFFFSIFPPSHLPSMICYITTLSMILFCKIIKYSIDLTMYDYE